MCLMALTVTATKSKRNSRTMKMKTMKKMVRREKRGQKKRMRMMMRTLSQPLTPKRNDLFVKFWQMDIHNYHNISNIKSSLFRYLNLQ